MTTPKTDDTKCPLCGSKLEFYEINPIDIYVQCQNVNCILVENEQWDIDRFNMLSSQLSIVLKKERQLIIAELRTQEFSKKIWNVVPDVEITHCDMDTVLACVAKELEKKLSEIEVR